MNEKNAEQNTLDEMIIQWALIKGLLGEDADLTPEQIALLSDRRTKLENSINAMGLKSNG